MKEIFSTVAVFQYSAEAQIIKGRLESEGINSFLVDNHTIDTDPLVSNAIGGVKLKVQKEDEEKARQVLDAISKYSVNDEGEQIICPEGNSDKVEFFTNVKSPGSLFFFGISFFVNTLPMVVNREYHCANCNNKFKQDEP